MKSQRDVFLENLFIKAKKDKDIYIIAVDLAAEILKKWQKELPEQFIYCGISEQNAINVASGLASQNKKVYVYFMAAWMCRCLEQVRYSLCMPNFAATILANGVGLGYAPAGPAHEPNEDIAYVKSLLNIEIYSPSNNDCVLKILNETLNTQKLRYIRLERTYNTKLDKYTYENSDYYKVLESNITPENKNKIALVSSGYMLSKCLTVYENLKNDYHISVIDVYKIKPYSDEKLATLLKSYDRILTIEEQNLSGGFGSSISEYLEKHLVCKLVEKLHLPERYIFENGTRDQLLDINGLSIDDIVKNLRNKC